MHDIAIGSCRLSSPTLRSIRFPTSHFISSRRSGLQAARLSAATCEQRFTSSAKHRLIAFGGRIIRLAIFTNPIATSGKEHVMSVIGEIIIWGGALENVPAGFLHCDGRLLNVMTKHMQRFIKLLKTRRVSTGRQSERPERASGRRSARRWAPWIDRAPEASECGGRLRNRPSAAYADP